MTTRVTIQNHGPQDILARVVGHTPYEPDNGPNVVDTTRLTVDESVDLYVYDSQSLSVVEAIGDVAGAEDDSTQATGQDAKPEDDQDGEGTAGGGIPGAEAA